MRPETIILTENVGNLKLIDVGFDQRSSLSAADATEDIYSFGKVLSETVAALPEAPAYLRKIAEKCMSPNPADRYRNIHELRMALAHRSDNKLYILIIVFLALMLELLAWLQSPWGPKRPDKTQTETEIVK